KQKTLMFAICENLKTWGLLYKPHIACSVLSGVEEGVLGWLSLNYLLNRISAETGAVIKQNKQIKQEEYTHNAQHTPQNNIHLQQNNTTGAMIEMGGASAQVVFELPLSILQREEIKQAAAAASAASAAAADAAADADGAGTATAAAAAAAAAGEA